MTTDKHTVDAIVHIGAGRGRDLDDHLSTGARRVVLVDADRIAAAALQGLVHTASQSGRAVEVIEAAVAGEKKNAQLCIYNLERVSSICEPASALNETYPGLRVLRSATLQTLTAATLIESLRIDPYQENSLVIDAPGEELSILQNLADQGMLSTFSRISINASRQPLYNGVAAVDDIEAFLRKADYAVPPGVGEEWVSLTAFSLRSRRDILEIKNLTVRLEEFDALKRELDRVEAQRSAHEKKVIEVTTENANLKADKASLSANNEKLQEKVAALEAKPLDLVDRKALFDAELARCEAQIDLLKGLLTNSHGK